MIELLASIISNKLVFKGGNMVLYTDYNCGNYVVLCENISG